MSRYTRNNILYYAAEGVYYIVTNIGRLTAANCCYVVDCVVVVVVVGAAGTATAGAVAVAVVVVAALLCISRHHQNIKVTLFLVAM